MPTWLFKHILNLWSPFRGAGIVITHLAPDWRYVRVELRKRLLNQNYVGTHFGGSLFAMTDPFYMLMLFKALGKDHVVWDKAASIDYIAPGRGTVHAQFQLDPATIEQIRSQALGGAAVYPQFDVEILNATGEVVARVHKQLYVRLKPRNR